MLEIHNLGIEVNMKSKIILMMLFFSILLFGCSGVSAINQKKSIADNQAVIADKVISYISVGDKDSLFEMFSQTEKTDETKNSLDRMFRSVDIYALNMDQIEQHVNGGGEEYRDGKIVQQSFGYRYESITDDSGNNYIIGFGYTLVNENNPSEVGLNSLSIRRVEYKDGYIPVVLDEYIAGKNY